MLFFSLPHEYAYLVNGNLLLVLLLFFSLAFAPKKSLISHFASLNTMIGILITACYLINMILPLSGVVSYSMLFLLLIGIAIQRNAVHSKVLLRNGSEFLFLLFLFNLSIAFFNISIFRYHIPFSVSENADSFIHEHHITFSQKYSLFTDICSSPKKGNLFVEAVCTPIYQSYPKGAFPFLAFIDSILPFSFVLRSEYIIILISIFLVSIFATSLEKKNFSYAALSFPLLFHPMIHFSVYRDHLSQIMAVPFLVMCIDVIFSEEKTLEEKMFFFMLSICGMVIVYPFGGIVLVPLILIFVGKQLSYLWQKRKTLADQWTRENATAYFLQPKFIGLLLLTVLLVGTSAVSTYRLTQHIVHEENPGNIQHLTISFSEVLGLRYFSTDVVHQQMSRKQIVLVLPFFILILEFLLSKRKNGAIKIAVLLSFFIVSVFIVFGKNYWIYKLSFYWVIIFFTCLQYFSPAKFLTKKLVIVTVLTISAVTSLIWARGVYKNYYNSQYRAYHSVVLSQQLPDILFVKSHLSPEKKTYVEAEKYFTSFLGVLSPDTQLIADSHYIRTDKYYQFISSNDDFIGNLDLNQVDQIIINSETYPIEYLPDFFVKKETYNTFTSYTKTLASLRVLPLLKNLEPRFVLDKKMLQTYIPHSENITFNYISLLSKNICNYTGKSESLDIPPSHFPIAIITGYQLNTENIQPSFSCQKYKDSEENNSVLEVDIGSVHDALYVENFANRELWPDKRNFRWTQLGKTPELLIPSARTLDSITFLIAPQDPHQEFRVESPSCGEIQRFTFSKADIQPFEIQISLKIRTCLEKDHKISFTTTAPSEKLQLLFDKVSLKYHNE